MKGSKMTGSGRGNSSRNPTLFPLKRFIGFVFLQLRSAFHATLKRSPGNAKASVSLSQRRIHSLKRIGQQRELRILIQRLAAVFAYDPHRYVPVGIIRYYTLPLIGGQEMQA
jgi:hypothetical protein